MNTEKLLESLFDFQRFEKNKSLQRIIEEVEGRNLCKELNDDEMEKLSAAGDPYLQGMYYRDKDGLS